MVVHKIPQQSIFSYNTVELWSVFEALVLWPSSKSKKASAIELIMRVSRGECLVCEWIHTSIAVWIMISVYIETESDIVQ